MEFKDMQIIWNNENQEKLYAIDEAALHDQIKRKGQSITRKLDFVEILMMGINLVVAILLIVDGIRDNDPAFAYILPLMYLGYAILGLVLRLRRQQKEDVTFAPTLIGELEKALWQINYLINQSRSMTVWYLLPLIIVAIITVFLNSGLVWALGLLVVVVPLAYFGSIWEINKFYLRET